MLSSYENELEQNFVNLFTIENSLNPSGWAWHNSAAVVLSYWSIKMAAAKSPLLLQYCDVIVSMLIVLLQIVGKSSLTLEVV